MKFHQIRIRYRLIRSKSSTPCIFVIGRKDSNARIDTWPNGWRRICRGPVCIQHETTAKQTLWNIVAQLNTLLNREFAWICASLPVSLSFFTFLGGVCLCRRTRVRFLWFEGNENGWSDVCLVDERNFFLLFTFRKISNFLFRKFFFQ